MQIRNTEGICKQCCGSMTFWGGSGSGSSDPCLWLLDPDADPDPGSGSCYFRHWPSRCQQKTNFLIQFFLRITFYSYIYIIFQRLKSKSNKIVRIKVYLTVFKWWSESRAGSGSGSIPLTSGSGSGRPKNMWIRWIRIRNTVCKYNFRLSGEGEAPASQVPDWSPGNPHPEDPERDRGAHHLPRCRRHRPREHHNYR